MTNYLQKNKQPSNGFTLIELLIAMGLGVALAVIMVATLTSGLNHIRTIKHAERLHENSSTASTKISHSIKTSKSITIPDPSTMEVEYMDLTKETFTVKEGSLMVNEVPITTGAVTVKHAEFTDLGESVRATLVLSAGEKELIINKTTTKRQTI